MIARGGRPRRARRRGILVAIFGVVAVARAIAAEGPTDADAKFFEDRIRPVLAEHCQKCHGEANQKGGLRLDSRSALLSGGDQGAAMMPGQPDESLLILAASYTDELLQMPPSGKLSDAQIADLAEWVRRGAPWPGDVAEATSPPGPSGEMVFTDAMEAHWSFQPPGRPQPPAEAEAGNPIDAFIGARLDDLGLASAPLAGPRAFLRRLTFDLTGLPPSPEDVEAFERAARLDRDSAVAAAIDRLLASPRHGERYARRWLDVARYADSNGSEVDHAMANAWRYRDYVVRAFNDDLPFDRFLVEQIAGDLLPAATAMEATGFLMLGPKALAELDKEKLHADVVDEQVDTVGRAFMGLTIGCARCHDHKFDPIPTADYYAIAGIFRSTRSMDLGKRVATWTERPIGEPEDLLRVEVLMERIGDLLAQRDAAGALDAATRPRLVLGDDADYLLIEAEDFRRGNVRVESDNLGKGIGVVRTLMEYPDHVEYEFELPASGDYLLELRYAAKESRPTELIINGNVVEMGAASEVTGDWRPASQRWFVQGEYAFREGRNILAFHRDGPVPLFDKLLIGRPGDRPYGPGVPVAPARAPVESVTKKELDAEITAAQRELERIPTTMAPFDGPVADAPILIRGNPEMEGPVVPRGFLRIVSGIDGPLPGDEQSGRLELARWLTHPDHPLTARVIVNRVWLWHFGQGLVASPDNFGLRGEGPSHPGLLDWLATWFVENGWSLKKLHALICGSETYQRATSAGVSPSDPENRLLAHFPRRRLDAEELRDAMLSVAGRLDPSMGGSLMTVLNRTYVNGGTAPRDVVEQLNYDAPRRSIYLPIVRTALNDLLATFDYPDPAMLTGRRASTTVAPQALFLMNSPFVEAQARAFADRVQELGDDDRARVRAAYELAFARPPADEETDGATAYLDREAAVLRDDGDPNPRASAWARFCHVLLISNEFLYLR